MHGIFLAIASRIVYVRSESSLKMPTGQFERAKLLHRRDCTGLSLTCGNEKAVEWFDKAVTAYVTARESPIPHLKEALRLDDTLLLAHCFMGFYLLADKPPTDPRVTPHVKAVSSWTKEMTEREAGHVKAFKAYASGNLPQATNEWAAILIYYPLDALALRFTFESYIVLGEFVKMRDLLARLLPHWREDMYFYPFIISLYAFSLEQTGQLDRAEELAKEALSMDKEVPWATHSLGHVIEEGQEKESGVEFLTSTRQDWCHSLLGGHMTWHLCLYYIDLGNTDAALYEFDNVLYHNAVEDSVFGLLDATSLLWRLEIVGVDPGEERWQKVTGNFSKLIGQHAVAWYDVHLMMSLVHGKVSECSARLALAEQMMKSLESYAQSNISTNCKVVEELGLPVCNALMAYSKEQYPEVLSLLLPLRYDIIHFGGSWAHRQILSVTIIQAAIKSNDIALALALVAELKALKPKSKRLEKLFKELKGAYAVTQSTSN